MKRSYKQTKCHIKKGDVVVAIAGDDWVQERVLELQLEYQTEIKPEKILSLKRGGVRIVSITRDDHSHDN